MSGEGGSKLACGSAAMNRPGEYKHGKEPTNQTNLIHPLPFGNQIFFCKIISFTPGSFVKSEDEL